MNRKQKYSSHPFAAMLLGIALALGVAVTAQAAPASDDDLILNGDAKCTVCHDKDEKTVFNIATTKHGVRGDDRTPTCTSCHGTSETHLNHKGGNRPKPDRTFNNNPATSKTERAAACLACHKGDATRTNWNGSAHQVNDLACTSCHQIHTVRDKVRDKKTQPEICFTCHKDQRAEFKKISHMPVLEGKMACSDCHNPHGTTGIKLLKKNTVNETCFQCHTEKRGPFLFEHQSATEDCRNCHVPHGSNISPLLKSRAPFLCEECHDGPHNSRNPWGPNVGGMQNGLQGVGGLVPTNGAASGVNPLQANPSALGSGRACLNCHVMVHGSNNPAGAWFHR